MLLLVLVRAIVDDRHLHGTGARVVGRAQGSRRRPGLVVPLADNLPAPGLHADLSSCRERAGRGGIMAQSELLSKSGAYPHPPPPARLATAAQASTWAMVEGERVWAVLRMIAASWAGVSFGL